MIQSLSSSSSCVVLVLLGFLFNGSSSLRSLYSKARQVRTLEGHDQALSLYREILKLNPNDVTAATRIAVDERSIKRHDEFGKGGNRIQRLRFIKLLESFDFNCNSIADLVFATDATKAAIAKRSSAPLFLHPLRATEGIQPPLSPTCSLGACIQLLLLAVCLPTKNCVDILGSEFVELLETLGLAYVSHYGNDDSNSLLVPYVHVFPVTVCDETIFLATDLHPNVLSLTTVGGNKDNVSCCGSTMEDNGTVMYIGPDSLALLDHWSCHQHLKDDDIIVDIGCGSGIQALCLAARSSGKANVKCVDINERALRVTRFNFEWNNFDAPTLILGNINSPAGRIFETEEKPKAWKELLGESTTYLVSNPPFLPVPVHDHKISSRYGLFSSGGANGEEFFQSLIRLASASLDRHNPSATLAVVSEFMNPDVNFGLRISSWWNDVDPAQALLLTNEEALDASVYANRRADSSEEASKWEHHLHQEGIMSISPGLMFLKRNQNTCGTIVQKETKNLIHYIHIVNATHYFVPKTSEGSIWTPTNFDARNFTQPHIKKFLRL